MWSLVGPPSSELSVESSRGLTCCTYCKLQVEITLAFWPLEELVGATRGMSDFASPETVPSSG